MIKRCLLETFADWLPRDLMFMILLRSYLFRFKNLLMLFPLSTNLGAPFAFLSGVIWFAWPQFFLLSLRYPWTFFLALPFFVYGSCSFARAFHKYHQSLLWVGCLFLFLFFFIGKVWTDNRVVTINVVFEHFLILLLLEAIYVVYCYLNCWLSCYRTFMSFMESRNVSW